MREYRYTTPHGIQVTRTVSKANFRKGLHHLLRDLDRHRGIYLSSGYEYPGRYSRWDIASARPPLEIVAYDRRVEFRPLNDRGRAVVRMFHPVLAQHPHWEDFGFEGQSHVCPKTCNAAENRQTRKHNGYAQWGFISSFPNAVEWIL